MQQLTDYRGFHIHPYQFFIYKDGKQVFTAWYQRADSLDEAKAMIDASIACQERQMQKRPSLCSYDLNELSDTVNLEDSERWTSQQHEIQMINDEN